MYRVAIRQNATGEIRIREFDSEWEEGSDFLWEEGNYSCDCNRSTFFHQSGPDTLDSGKCGDERFDVISITLPDGTEVYSEQRFTEPPTPPTPPSTEA